MARGLPRTLTLDRGRLDRRCHSLVTHPLGAAPPRHLYSPGAWAVPAGQPHILRAQRQAGEAAVVTAAQDPAIGFKGLPIQVPAAVHLTAPVILFHCTGEKKEDRHRVLRSEHEIGTLWHPAHHHIPAHWLASLFSKTERHPGAWLGRQLCIFLAMGQVISLLASVSPCEK